MNRSDVQAVMEGLDSIGRAADSMRDRKERADALRLQMLARERELAENRELQKALVKMRVEQDERNLEARKHETRARLEADALRRFGAHWDKFGDFVRKESDPVGKLARLKAERELATLEARPTGKGPDELLSDEVKRLKMQKERDALISPPGPTGKVTQSFGPDGKSRAQFSAPVEEIKKSMRAGGYRSPYADDIADLGRSIAGHQAEIDGGDERTGFLNINSRQGEVESAARKRRRLQALELQDMLSNGVIDQAEADRRAEVILKGGAK